MRTKKCISCQSKHVLVKGRFVIGVMHSFSLRLSAEYSVTSHHCFKTLKNGSFKKFDVSVAVVSTVRGWSLCDENL